MCSLGIQNGSRDLGIADHGKREVCDPSLGSQVVLGSEVNG